MKLPMRTKWTNRGTKFVCQASAAGLTGEGSCLVSAVNDLVRQLEITYTDTVITTDYHSQITIADVPRAEGKFPPLISFNPIRENIT